ncbi:MAG: hypothetical protein WDO68_16645 [Gammaproteobacteria bacterium]
MWRRTLGAMLSLLFVVGCQTPRAEFQLCEVKSGVFQDEATVIDLNAGIVRGSDVSISAKMVRTEFAAGFMTPYPLVLPTVPPNELPPHWELENYRFTVSSPQNYPGGWMLIDAEPFRAETGKAGARSSVLYSPSKGVVAVQVSGQTPDRILTADWVFCGTGTLRGSSFR